MAEQQNKKTLSKAVVISRDQHNVSRRNISDAALRVLKGLNAAGYDSYLVGGGVRDLLLGHQPKDFDIGTEIDVKMEILETTFTLKRASISLLRRVSELSDPNSVVWCPLCGLHPEPYGPKP